jgi:hypothetical protein
VTDDTGSQVTFQAFVASLAATTSATLEHVRALLQPEGEGAPGEGEESRAKIRTGLETARQLVDTIGVLEQKTKGNLTDDEQRLLQAVLTEARITFVKLQEMATKSA